MVIDVQQAMKPFSRCICIYFINAIVILMINTVIIATITLFDIIVTVNSLSFPSLSSSSSLSPLSSPHPSPSSHYHHHCLRQINVHLYHDIVYCD